MQTHKLLQFSEESRAYWHGRCGPPDLATNKRTFYRSNSYSSCRYQLHVSHDAAPNSASHPRGMGSVPVDRNSTPGIVITRLTLCPTPPAEAASSPGILTPLGLRLPFPLICSCAIGGEGDIVRRRGRGDPKRMDHSASSTNEFVAMQR